MYILITMSVHTGTHTDGHTCRHALIINLSIYIHIPFIKTASKFHLKTKPLLVLHGNVSVILM